eukprot:GDKJ01013979.1.p1 GENE.GDKJ01013979.1~~GDKJ01013979.1.p1  ORF type:complete len:466 (-),score=60.45 GDKJ01013979.1:91-1488(-)
MIESDYIVPMCSGPRSDMDWLFMYSEGIDGLFVLCMSMLVMLMQLGFALFDVGLVQSKNVTSVLIKKVMSMTFGVVIFYMFGYGLARGEDWGGFMGVTKFGLVGVTGMEMLNFIFQFSFAITTSAIVSGVLSERGDFSAFMWYNTLLTGIVYPVASHWVTNEKGWLAALGMLDTAGSAVVHICGGAAALIGTIVTGPRHGRFVNDVRTRTIRTVALPHHSVPFFAFGGMLLMCGFIAFNAGSNGRITSCSLDREGKVIIMHSDRVVKLAVNTILAGFGGGVSGLVWSRRFMTRWSLVRVVMGWAAGFVSVCGCAGRVSYFSALFIGAVGGFTCSLTSRLLIAHGADDPVDSVAIHLSGGVVGTLLHGLLDVEQGVLYKGEWHQFWIQLFGCACLCLWTCVFMMFVFTILKRVKSLRVSIEEERDGLDRCNHDGFGYNFDISSQANPQYQPSMLHTINPNSLNNKN